LTRQLDALRGPHKKKLFEAQLALIPQQLRDDLTSALQTEVAKRNAVQTYLVQKFGDIVTVTSQEIDASLTEGERSTCARLAQQIDTLKAWHRDSGRIRAAWEEGPPVPFHLLLRGDSKTPGPIVKPGLLTVLTPSGHNETPAGDPKSPSSGRRLALARWLTSRDHPLTARVMVNRIWQEHFGKGIVSTPENFGRMGSAPSHPELLDWLAVDFMDHGWKIKRLHKLIMTSTAYRQSSSVVGEDRRELAAEKADPANTLLWHMNLRRLEAEDIRDSVLDIAGKLDLTMGGPPVPIDIGADGLTTVAQKPPAEGPFEKIKGSYIPLRRSVYLFARRNYPVTFLEVFDFPIMAVNCTRRSLSATPLQSLALLNSEFMMEQANQFAARVTQVTDDGASTEKKVDTAFLLALSRRPTASELRLAEDHLEKIATRFKEVGTPERIARERALSSLCQMLMATNEFLYIE
jgi:hypothetical protein